MNDRVRIAGAVAGGYLLGRTKKGRMAIKMALWLAGSDYRPANLLRTGVGRLAERPELAELGSQMSGPLRSAGQQAIEAALEAQVNRLADMLEQRTKVIADAGSIAEDSVANAKGTADGLKDSGRKGLERSSGNGDEPADDEGSTAQEGGRSKQKESARSRDSENLADERESDEDRTDERGPDEELTDERKSDEDRTDEREPDEELTDEREPDEDRTDEREPADERDSPEEEGSSQDGDESEDRGSGRSTRGSSDDSSEPPSEESSERASSRMSSSERSSEEPPSSGRHQDSESDRPVAVRTSKSGA
ncbi:MAG: hypothetical protein ACJ786_32790 [Catenulispora sp.]